MWYQPSIPQFVVLRICVLVCLHADQSATMETGVFWKLETNPVVFYRNVTLKCTATKDCCDSGSWKWTGGRNNRSISYNEASDDKTKYVAKRLGNGSVLVIQDFDDNDANKIYTCIYRFDKYTANLELDDYEIQPTNQTMKATHTIIDNVFMIDIHFSKVYPPPICNLTLDAINIEPTVNSRFLGIFYQVNISANYTFNDTICGGKLKTVCKVGTAPPVNVADVGVWNTSCSDISIETVVQVSPGIVIGVITGIGVPVCCVVVGIAYFKKKRLKTKSKLPAEDIGMNDKKITNGSHTAEDMETNGVGSPMLISENDHPDTKEYVADKQED